MIFAMIKHSICYVLFYPKISDTGWNKGCFLQNIWYVTKGRCSVHLRVIATSLLVRLGIRS